MEERPRVPPQKLKSGDRWSTEVAIYLDGELSDGLWISVNGPAGEGVRYVDPIATDDETGSYRTETVYGVFEVRWLPDSLVPSLSSGLYLGSGSTDIGTGSK